MQLAIAGKSSLTVEFVMTNTLYHSANIGDPPDQLNDSISSHVIVKSDYVYYKTRFKVSYSACSY